MRNVFFLALVFVAQLAAGCIENPDKADLVLSARSATLAIDHGSSMGDWKDAYTITEFHRPWNGALDEQTTWFLQTDSSFLFFAFDVVDHQLVVVPSAKESDVASGDRVELFFSGQKDLANYYCFEIDPDGRVLDYRASFYREFDDSWNCPAFEVTGRRTARGYWVAGKVPFAVLDKLGVLQYDEENPYCYIGAYRAEYSIGHPCDTTVQWITWVNPAVSSPDFHIPSSFGKVTFKR